jgi:glutamate racemase
MSDAPLLIFDSGVGGLSVLAPIRALLPAAPIVYVADNAGYPYGTRRPEEIAVRVPTLLGRLAERYMPRLIVIACNTASTIALDGVRAALDLPVVGTVPAIKPAAERSQSRVIAILGTEATVRQPYVDRLIEQFASDCTIIRHGSAALVDMAEGKLRGDAPELAEVQAAIRPLLDAPAPDTVVLACTHFPLLKDELQRAFPQPVAFVDGAEGIARRTAFLLRDETWPLEAPSGTAVFTRASPAISAYRPGLATYGLTNIETL